MTKVKIGITKQQCIEGTAVNYYSFYDEVDGSHSEPKPTSITAGPYEMCGTVMCKVEDVSAVVALTHLEIVNN